MTIKTKDVHKIARLASLSITETETEKLTSELASILDLVDQLNQVDTTGIEPLANPLNATQRLREDKVTEGNQREQLLANAPQIEAGLFLVPQVIDSGE